MAHEASGNQSTTSIPVVEVTVRMYRAGLGDCFLLAFPSTDGNPRYMLIDCGVLRSTKGGADRLRAIAQDIAETTGNWLHVLVATHEHWDHLSGFQYAQETFDQMVIDEVWMPWTEDPEDELAGRLRQKRATALAAVTAAAARLGAAGRPEAEALEAVLDFYRGPGIDGRINTTAEQWEYVQGRGDPPRYLRPGERPITLPGVDGVRFYVLGPPRDEELLSRSDPSTAESEVYEHAFALNQASAFYLAALAAGDQDALTPDQRELLEHSRPFDESFWIRTEDAATHEDHGLFFQKRYGFAGDDDRHGPAWRRIDHDWLAAAGQLALDLDSDTNNTCLALAIELEASGKVLLFPADAQVGNWLSWHSVSWPGGACGEGGEAEPLTGTDLVRRTVFYKVGHHGSHNATLRDKGLELMESPDLVAAIPVDHELAARQGKHGWSMPFPSLEERLRQKTRGRVLRADTGVPEKPDAVPAAEWQAFLDDVEESELWIEYTERG